MSEQTEPKPSGDTPLEPPINLYDYGEDHSDPSELSDDEIHQYFLSQCRHPSASAHSDTLGEFIQSLLGNIQGEDSSSTQQIWRDRLEALKADIDGFQPDVAKRIVQGDEVLQEMHRLAIATREKAADLHEERRALMYLRDLRAGVISRDLVRDKQTEQWKELLKKLFPHVSA